LERPPPLFSIGGYDVERVLRETVNFVDYRARHRDPSWTVRLRCDDPRGIWKDSPSNGLFQRGRALQASMHHAGIVPVKEMFEVDGRGYTVFQWIEGARGLESYYDELDGPMPIGPYLDFCERLTSAVAAVHEAGFVHGLLAAHAILVDESLRPYLLDLSLASLHGRPDPLAPPGRAAGVNRYMAPELLVTDEPIRSTAEDIFALGVILFELRYGRWSPRHDGPGLCFPRVVDAGGRQADAVHDTRDRYGRPLDLSAHAITLPEPRWDEEALIRGWLASLLAVRPEQREHDATEAARSLRYIARALDDRPSTARAFIIMPFHGVAELGEEVRAACADHRVRAERGDELFAHDSVWRDIEQGIAAADFVVALCYGQDGGFNPNVMVEVGLALALDKPLLLLAEEPETLPFDLRSLRVLAVSPQSSRDPTFRSDLRKYVGDLVHRVAPSAGR